MKRHVRDILSDAFITIARPIVFWLMKRELKVVHHGDVIPKERAPFVLISNHFNTWDSFVVMTNVKAFIRFVATEIAYLDWSKKLGMKHLARTIKKRVGKPDIQATRRIYEAVRQGYAIGLFPEGDNTFYGETLDIYQSTGKLLKRLNVDVILIKQQGGYLSQPRWADHFSKQGVVHTTTRTLIPQSELATKSDQEINDIVRAAIYNNDYDFQREQMIDMNRKHRAEGIERLVYLCSECRGVLTVKGVGDDIVCDTCGTIGTINTYEFIEGNRFDNLVDYNHFQYAHIEDVVNSTFAFDVTFNTVDVKRHKNHKLGTYTVHYENLRLRLENGTDERIFEIKKMRYPVNTMRHSFSFDYEGVTYNFTDIRHQFVLYELCRHVNGSYKE